MPFIKTTLTNHPSNIWKIVECIDDSEWAPLVKWDMYKVIKFIWDDKVVVEPVDRQKKLFTGLEWGVFLERFLTRDWISEEDFEWLKDYALNIWVDDFIKRSTMTSFNKENILKALKESTEDQRKVMEPRRDDIIVLITIFHLAMIWFVYIAFPEYLHIPEFIGWVLITTWLIDLYMYLDYKWII